MELLPLIAQFGGAGTPLLLLAYIIWQIVDKSKSKSHDDLDRNEEARMLECVQEVKDHVTSTVDKMKAETAPMARQVEWLKEIHDQKDEDGVPVWYNRRSLEKALEENVKTQSKNIEVAQETNEHLAALVDELRRAARDN